MTIYFYKILRKYFHRLVFHLPHEVAHNIIYRSYFGKSLDLKNPRDLNEKIHWLVIHKFGELEARLLDKYLVKEYLADLNISDLHIAKLYGVYDRIENIDLDMLPERFVLKTTHGCCDKVICLNKTIFNFESFKKGLQKSLKREMSKETCEYFSLPVKKAIICEEYLDDGELIYPIDYKFHCFNGKTKIVMVATDREYQTKFSIYDISWNKLDWVTDNYKEYREIEKPVNFERMIEIAEELSKPFLFVRIDLYNIKGMIYFGEFTFTPADGNIMYLKQNALNEMGEFIELDI